MNNKTVAKSIRVLVVEADPHYFNLFQSAVACGGQFEPTFVDRLSKALTQLKLHSYSREPYDIVLLDLSLPDSLGLDTFLQVYAQAPELPIVALAPAEDASLAIEVIREGGQDCLFKGEVDGALLVRSLLFSIERHRAWVMLHQLCLTDDLTGLLNRRGFMSMAEQQIKIAQRENWKLLVLFTDLDGLKNINDNYGHPKGDQALRRTADILRETFRTSDLVARLGGDEFIVLAVNVSEAGVRSITERLQKTIDRYNALDNCYQISLSWGIAHFDPHSQISLDEVIVQADQALYEHKRAKQRHQLP